MFAWGRNTQKSINNLIVIRILDRSLSQRFTDHSHCLPRRSLCVCFSAWNVLKFRSQSWTCSKLNTEMALAKKNRKSRKQTLRKWNRIKYPNSVWLGYEIMHDSLQALCLASRLLFTIKNEMSIFWWKIHFFLSFTLDVFFCCLQINYFIFCWFGSCVHKLHLFCCIFPITDIKSKRNRLALEKGEIYFAYYAKSKENQKLLYHIAGANTVWDNKSVFSFNVITYLFTPRICCY